MIIIKILGSCSGYKHLPSWNSKFVVTDGDNYTHAIVFQHSQMSVPKLDIPKERVIGVACEPPPYIIDVGNMGLNKAEFFYQLKSRIGYFLVGGVDNRHIPRELPFTELHVNAFDAGMVGFQAEKKKTISMMISQKSFVSSWKNRAPGYDYRRKLVNNILHHNLPVDIYGNGCAYLPSDKRVKGEFVGGEPYKDYRYTIAIENFSYPHYISEKALIPIRYNTIPVYWGCKNINKYYKNSCVQLSGNLTQDLRLILDITRRPQKYRRSLKAAQNDILFKNNVISRAIQIWKH